MQFTYKETPFTVNRYPESSNQSLQAWSAADELLLQHLDEHKSAESSETKPVIAVYHDRFGFLGTVLHQESPWVVLTYSSQEKSLRQNLVTNGLQLYDDKWKQPLDQLPENADVVLMKIPKSMDLFTLYMHHAWNSVSDNDATIYAGFLTRHFSPQMIEIAERYFEEVEQSKARKKARVIIMRKKKKDAAIPSDIRELMHEVSWEGNDGDNASEAITLKHFYGVFSADDIDPATRLLFSHLEIREHEQVILDLGCGNGIIAYQLKLLKPYAELHAMDDDILAVESAKLNLGDSATVHHYDGLDMFPNEFFDLIVTNPPAHLEHENNIEVSLGLFTQAYKKLKTGGRLIITSGRHLNYLSHLKKLFTENRIVGSSDKFEVTESIKQAEVIKKPEEVKQVEKPANLEKTD